MRVLGIALAASISLFAPGCANEGSPVAKPKVFVQEVSAPVGKTTVQQRAQSSTQPPVASTASQPIEVSTATHSGGETSAPEVRSARVPADAQKAVTMPPEPVATAAVTKAAPSPSASLGEKDFMAATLPLPPAAIDGKSSVAGLVLLIAGVTSLIFWVLYRRSQSSRMNRGMGEIIASFEATLQGQKDLTEKMETAIKATAADYLNQIRRDYLLATSIDEVRRLAPGVRLKPLHDHGLTTLLAVQGWDASRFIQLRGIGPDSAHQIAVACATLSKAAISRPVPHPRVTDGGSNGQQLFRQIYAFGQVREKLAGQAAALSAILKEWRPRCKAVESQTTFLRWMIGSESKGALHAALTEGTAIEMKLAREDELGHALEDGRSRLNDAIRISQQPVVAQSVAADVGANAEFYRSFFLKFLGNEVSQPREARQTMEGQIKPAREPVRLRTSSGTTPGFSISISIGESAPPEIPTDSAAHAAESWVPSGRKTTIGRFEISGGMIYVGKRLQSINGATIEPALIDPAQTVAVGEADCHVRMLNYWSSYSYASQEARASYLQWLSTGRNDPAADVG